MLKNACQQKYVTVSYKEKKIVSKLRSKFTIVKQIGGEDRHLRIKQCKYDDLVLFILATYREGISHGKKLTKIKTKTK